MSRGGAKRRAEPSAGSPTSMGPRLMSRGGGAYHYAREAMTTSMGPRLMSRGGEPLRVDVFVFVATSMGPRLMSRGGGPCLNHRQRHLATSMGPRLISRGGTASKPRAISS